MTELRPQSSSVTLPGGLTTGLLEGLNLPLVVTDARADDNPIVFVSSAFQSILGYAAEDVLGRNCRFLQGEDTDVEAKARMRRAVKAGMSETVDLLNYRASGEPFMNRVLIVPLYDGHGEVEGFLGVQREIFPQGDPLSARLSRSMAFPRIDASRIDDLLEDLRADEDDAVAFAWDIAGGALYGKSPEPGAEIAASGDSFLKAREFLNSLHPNDIDDFQANLAAAFESPTASFATHIRQRENEDWRAVNISGRFVYVGESATPTLLCVYLPS